MQRWANLHIYIYLKKLSIIRYDPKRQKSYKGTNKLSLQNFTTEELGGGSSTTNMNISKYISQK